MAAHPVGERAVVFEQGGPLLGEPCGSRVGVDVEQANRNRVVLILAIGALAGVLASRRPARAAARIDVLTAVASK